MGKISKYIFLQRRHTDGQEHMKRCSTSLIIREMRIKTTKRCHLTPVRMVNTKITMAERVWRKGSPPTLVLGIKIASGTVENSMEDPQKTKSRITLYSSNPTPGHIP